LVRYGSGGWKCSGDRSECEEAVTEESSFDERGESNGDRHAKIAFVLFDFVKNDFGFRAGELLELLAGGLGLVGTNMLSAKIYLLVLLMGAR
jgi:hypothetical protein